MSSKGISICNLINLDFSIFFYYVSSFWCQNQTKPKLLSLRLQPILPGFSSRRFALAPKCRLNAAGLLWGVADGVSLTSLPAEAPCLASLVKTLIRALSPEPWQRQQCFKLQRGEDCSWLCIPPCRVQGEKRQQDRSAQRKEASLLPFFVVSY